MTQTRTHKHPGQCTTTRLYTAEEARTELTSRGFTWNAEACEWTNGTVRGRLAWSPNFCDFTDKRGTQFWLSLPGNAGRYALLGS